MYIQLCDRCGKQTDNGPAFLVPTTVKDGRYQIGGVWFGDGVVLCDDCIEDFENFMINHKHFTIEWVETNE